MNATSKHDYKPLEIAEFRQDKPAPVAAPSSAAAPNPASAASAASASAAAPARSASAAYVAKQGDLTVDEVEEELGMLLERMEFLEKTLQRLKKENAKDLWRVCTKQNNCESVGKPSSPQKDWHLGMTIDMKKALERVASCTDKNAYGSESTCRLGMSVPHAPHTSPTFDDHALHPLERAPRRLQHLQLRQVAQRQRKAAEEARRPQRVAPQFQLSERGQV